MDTITIDFDVFKALTAKRRSQDMTYNDVLRELLGLGAVAAPLRKTASALSASKPAFVSKGIAFPSGAEFRATYKGKTYRAQALKNAMVLEDGYHAKSPSDAAVHITKNSVNGWRFWECRFPETTDWILLDILRRNLKKFS